MQTLKQLSYGKELEISYVYRSTMNLQVIEVCFENDTK